MNLVFIGLTLSSSWGNGHATTYRALLKALAARGHHITFLEEDQPWYADNRDLPRPGYCELYFYRDPADLCLRFEAMVKGADAVMVGSYVPHGSEVGAWTCSTASGPVFFYDIDTPVTLAALSHGGCAYVSREVVPLYDAYLSFSGGPTLDRLCEEFGARAAHAFYCSVDPDLYYPEPETVRVWDLGYMGTYSPDRQPTLEELLIGPARQLEKRSFIVAGPQFPSDTQWPLNVYYTPHLPPVRHRHFYNAQRYTLNVTRADMVAAGYSPSVRLFEAAACGTPIISDYWPGLETLLEPGEEILTAGSTAEVIWILANVTDATRIELGERARRKVLTQHTAAHRAIQLETLLGHAPTAPATIINTAEAMVS